MFNTTKPTAEQQLELDRIAIRIRSKLPGFFVLSGLADIVFTDDIPTACTNGRTVWFGNEFWAKLNSGERAFVWMHEILHIAGKHHIRRQWRDSGQYNEACDYAINFTLVELARKFDFISMPSGENAGLFDAKYADMTEAEIYDTLGDSDSDSDSGSGDSGDSGDSDSDSGSDSGSGDSGSDSGSGEQAAKAACSASIGGVIDGSFDTPEQAADEAERISATVQRAAVAERMAGNGSGGPLQRLADVQAKASRPLRAYLQQFVEQAEPTSGDWSRANKRLAAAGIHYASYRSESIEPLLFAIDTSGSVSEPELERMAEIVADVFSRSAFQKLHVCYFNSEVYNVDTFRSGERFKLSETQRGGTAFKPIFEAARRLKPKAVIVLTDGHGESQLNKPRGFDVCWLLTGPYAKRNMPFGKVIRD